MHMFRLVLTVSCCKWNIHVKTDTCSFPPQTLLDNIQNENRIHISNFPTFVYCKLLFASVLWLSTKNAILCLGLLWKHWLIDFSDSYCRTQSFRIQTWNGNNWVIVHDSHTELDQRGASEFIYSHGSFVHSVAVAILREAWNRPVQQTQTEVQLDH